MSQLQVTLGDRNEEDVPLLSAIGDTDDEDITEREDVRLLDVSAESEESGIIIDSRLIGNNDNMVI